MQYRAAFLREHLSLLFPQVLHTARRELDACRGVTPRRQAHSSQAYALALDDGRQSELLGDVSFGTGGRSRRKRSLDAG